VTLIGTSLGGRVALELDTRVTRASRRARPRRPGLDGHQWSNELEAFWNEEEQALERGRPRRGGEVNVRAVARRTTRAGGRALVAEMQRELAFELQAGHDDVRMASSTRPRRRGSPRSGADARRHR
jgi:hypothetical protein